MGRKGFTLIELVMVIVIIGILAAVAIPRFIDLRNEARKAVCQSDVGAIRTGIANWYAQFNVNGSCPSTGNCSANGFPVTAQLNSSNSFFGTNYFADGTLPKTSDITGAANSTWSSFYNETTGVLNITSCCG
jgi:prepilin-type N-terminal cleavage/methylation domain-containing protein